MTGQADLSDLGLLAAQDAGPESRELLDAAAKQMGMVPNLYAEMAHVPGLLATYRFGYDHFRAGSGFSPAEQEVVLLSVSRFNTCTYCVAVHSTTADRARVPAAVVDAIRDGRTVEDERLGALREFTTEMVATRGRPSQEALEAFLKAGYTREQALAVVLAVAVKTISNYTNHLFHTPLDPVFAGRAWSPAV